MKNVSLLLIVFLGLISCTSHHEKIPVNMNLPAAQLTDSSDMTNSFFDNTETHVLPMKDLIVEGEVANGGKVNFSELPLHSVIVKEAILDSAGDDRFVGAYRYDGYSLFDILDKRILKKSNNDEFKPVIDVYVEVENEQGEKVAFSWGEIFYPNNLHKIIIATGVSRIVPSKTKDLWPLSVESKIVVAGDLITERNISSPVKITVKTYPGTFLVVKDLSPLYSSHIKIFSSSKLAEEIANIPENLGKETFNTIFYGRGRGIHSTLPFSGILLKDLLLKYYPVSRENLKSGIMCFAGADGYRCAVTYSELFNRNDQQEFLLVKTKQEENGGLFRIFPASDFFSDRAIKSVSEIHLGF